MEKQRQNILYTMGQKKIIYMSILLLPLKLLLMEDLYHFDFLQSEYLGMRKNKQFSNHIFQTAYRQIYSSFAVLHSI